jgi:hypothetical protein
VTSQMNNCKFLQHPHYCLIYKTQIDMKKIERYISDCIYYEHRPDLMPGPRENDPIVVRDHGNDAEIVCSEDCLCEYVGCQLGKVDV